MATVSNCDRCRIVLTNATGWLKLKPAVQWTDGSSMAKEPDIDLCRNCYDATMFEFKSFADAGKAK